MKRSYVKPELNASMNGTLEGVYAYACGPTWYIPCQPDKKTSCNYEEPPRQEYGCEWSFWIWLRITFGW